MPSNVQIQQIRPDFSSSNAMMNTATNTQRGVGSILDKWTSQIEQAKADAENKRRYENEQTRLDRQEARQAILDDRATQLWNEQQAEKEMLKNAGLMKAVERDTILAQDPRFDTAIQQAQNAGLDTGSMGVQGVMNWYNQKNPQGTPNVNIGAGPVSFGSAGGPIFKNVTVSGGTSTQPVPGAQPPQASTISNTPAVAKSGATPAQPNKDYTNIIPNTLLGGTTFRPWDTVVDANKKLGEGIINVSKDLLGPVYNQVRSAIQGGGTKQQQVKVLSQNELNPAAPKTPMPQTKGTAKADKILSPTTPKEQKQSTKTIAKTTEKVMVGMSSGTPPKLNQIEAATIDKIFNAVDPNSQTRSEAKATIESMYYALGMNPKQVKEYSEGAVEAVYGDKNDPVKLALANAKLSAYEKNIEQGNRLGLEMYKLNTDVAMKNAEMAQRERLSKSEGSDKLPPGYTLWKDPKTGEVKTVLLSTAQKAEGSAINQNTPEGKAAYQASVNTMYNNYRKTFKENDSSWIGKAPLSYQQWINAGMPPL